MTYEEVDPDIEIIPRRKRTDAGETRYFRLRLKSPYSKTGAGGTSWLEADVVWNDQPRFELVLYDVAATVLDRMGEVHDSSQLCSGPELKSRIKAVWFRLLMQAGRFVDASNR